MKIEVSFDIFKFAPLWNFHESSERKTLTIIIASLNIKWKQSSTKERVSRESRKICIELSKNNDNIHNGEGKESKQK